MLAGGDETREIALETTTIEITTMGESETEITTIGEVLDTTNESENINILSEMTTESDSDDFTTEIDKDLDDYTTEVQAMTTEIIDETNAENSTKVHDEINEVSMKSIESRSRVLEITAPSRISTKSTEEIERISTKTLQVFSTVSSITTQSVEIIPAISLKLPEEIDKTTAKSTQKKAENIEEVPGNSEVKPNNSDMKVKVQKVLIFKRPIHKNSSETTTESMVTISRTENSESFFNLKSVELSFIDITAKAIIFWKTSLMVLLILILIGSLSYYRRRIIRLKAEIIQKNLGNSFNQSCSSYQSANAYTPTHFPRRNTSSNTKYPNIVDSDYDSSARSRSNYYSQTYNSASHSYESIDDQSNDHIYAEIGVRKGSIDSQTKPNNSENNSVTSCKFILPVFPENFP